MESSFEIYKASWKNVTSVKILTEKEKGLGGSNAPLRDTALGILIATAKTSKKKGKTTEKQFRAKYENKDPEGISRAPKIPKKNIVLPTGEKPPTSDIEASMKWQSENSIYQNKVLNNIDNTIKNVSHTQNKMMSKVETIEKKMEQISSHYAGLIKALELRILHEVFCGDTGQRQEKMRRQLFEMKCSSFDRNVIVRHIQKMAKIYFKIGGDINLKQAFVSSLSKLLASRTMSIIEEKFQSITIPQIGYIRQVIFVALDDICMKRSALKQIIQHNIALDKACRKSDLITGSGCSCHTYR
uniref:Uncharacterized protein LOC104220645 n=1 Tax=Nicotiana sylvestris TaxID=4096 RepID=A0A1U7VPK9_NICSY|nr:PREDICTED: uncharacterized protein LOC104220645 [Nicotiana sylvestris]